MIPCLLRASMAVLLLAGLLVACGDDDTEPSPAGNDGTPTAPAPGTPSPSNGDADPTPTDDAEPTPEGPTFPTAVITVEGEGVSEELTVEVASTREQTTRGLMFREEMAEDEGMLFVYPDGAAVGHWMRNTLIPLDIAYLDEEGRVQEIREGEPLNEEVLRPRIPYHYVLEVNLGWFERHGLGVGDTVVIPDDLPVEPVE